MAAVLVPCVSAAVPGPDSVVVLADATAPGSEALARRYAAARQIPDRQVCLVDAPDTIDVGLEDFRTAVLAPLTRCLIGRGIADRVEAIVVTRGLPLRVEVRPGERVSLAAALALGRSVRVDGTPLLGQSPGRAAQCGGSPCRHAAWRNPFRDGVFEPGWARDADGVRWRPLLVTMLHGRTEADAARLVEAAVAAEGVGAAGGEVVLMDGADPARGVLDGEHDAIVAELSARGLAARRVPFAPDLVGLRLAGFFTGTAALGTTVEGNTFAPGALVDNVTSFGAVPENFAEAGEVQVSVARWVAMGVTGVHGTTDEPLNDVFPSRQLMVDYADGSTLAEAYFRHLPFAYWHNLVLGDPMAAPHAVRPVVSLGALEDGEALATPRRLSVRAHDPAGRGVASLRLFVDGVEVARADGDALEACLAGRGEAQVLAVAQGVDDGSPGGRFRPKGWAAVRVTLARGECGDDAGAPDASGDGGAADARVRDAGVRDAGLDTAVRDATHQADALQGEAGVPGADDGSAPMVADAAGLERPDGAADAAGGEAERGSGEGCRASPSASPWGPVIAVAALLVGALSRVSRRRVRSRRTAHDDDHGSA